MHRLDFHGMTPEGTNGPDAIDAAFRAAKSTNSLRIMTTNNTAIGGSEAISHAPINPDSLAVLIDALHSQGIHLHMASFKGDPKKVGDQFGHCSLIQKITMPEGLNGAGDILKHIVLQTREAAMSLVYIEFSVENLATGEAILSVTLHTQCFSPEEHALRIVGNGRRISGQVATALTAIGIPVRDKEFAVVHMITKE